MTDSDEHALRIVTYLLSRGHFVDYDRASDAVLISPKPDAALIERLEANSDVIQTFLASLPDRPPSNHAFVCVQGCAASTVQDFGVCLACGIPWISHGEPPVKVWRTVIDIERVKLLNCAPFPYDCSCGVGS